MATWNHLPRLSDVAARAGVSLATASRAMSASSGVSTEVAGHVRAVADQMGYIANVHARSLAGGASSTIGLIVHEIGDPYFSEIASGALRAASRQSRIVQIVHAERTPESESAQIRALRANRVGAMIIAGSGYTDVSLEKETEAELVSFQSSGGRVAVIGRYHLPADAVLPDNEAAGLTLGRHVLGLGHRRIALVAGSAGLNTIQDRLAGISVALSEAGMVLEDVNIIHEEFTREGGASATEEVLARYPETTVVIALSDQMAIGALATLREWGVQVPGKMSVAGFDDIAVAADLAPSLTTVEIFMVQMGALAVELTMAKEAHSLRRRHTGHALKIRDSTGAPRPD